MSDEQKSMMTQLQQLGLTMDDLREYLDTHLYDDFAIERFNNTVPMYQQAAAKYSERYGPLWQSSASNDNESWQWALTGFPWDL